MEGSGPARAATLLVCTVLIAGCVELSEEALVAGPGGQGNHNVDALGTHPLIGAPVSELLDARGEPRAVYSLPQGRRALIYPPEPRGGRRGCVDTYMVSRGGTVFGYECQ